MDHFWRKSVRINNHEFIGHWMGFHRPYGEQVKFGSYLIDSCGRYWNKQMIQSERAVSWNWN